MKSNNGIKAKVRQFIESNFLHTADIDSIDNDHSLREIGVIDSTGVLELIGFIEEEFNIIIENEEIIPENLDSINYIEGFIKSKM